MHRLQQRVFGRAELVVECKRRIPSLPLHDDRLGRKSPQIDVDLPDVPPGALERLRRQQSRLPEPERPRVYIEDVRREEYENWRRDQERTPEEKHRGEIILQL